ncbi:DUF427 domain-containing protein [Actinocorallia longicatena]|uniref:DUF427 domain-containing protein n=1 Tax=Actinocorallia longicatena TaxID=111803 RepID=A0ABP6QMY9_9ACTN
MGTDSGLKAERGAKRVRAQIGGVTIADTARPLLVWHNPRYPAYYFPVEDVADGHLDEKKIKNFEGFGDHVTFPWNQVDAWFEEDEEIFVHPRSPYTRIDVLQSSRHVRVVAGGVTIAESDAPRILFETGLPPRIYLPKTHARMDLLEPTGTVTHCPYKGRAEYWAFDAEGERIEDVAWSYPAPLPESQKIIGLLSFYPDRTEIYVDGERW